MLWSRKSPLSAILTLVLVAITGSACGRAGDADQTVEDPRTYAITMLSTVDLNSWWQPYRNDDPALLGEVVDEEAARLPKGLPEERGRLERLVRTRIASRYRQRMEGTSEGKAFILARAEARFAAPPSAVWDAKGRYALLDYHVLPGEWKAYNRISEGLKNPPAMDSRPFLKPEIIAASLERLVAAHPDAKTYQIRYAYHFGSGLERVLMAFSPDGRIVYRRGPTVAFTAEPVPWDDLRAGRVALKELEWDYPMEGYGPSAPASPPKDPLPMAD